jgi:hypothetical protein
VVTLSQRNEELRLNNLVYNLTISKTGLKVVSSDAFPGGAISFLEAMIGVCERVGQDLSNETKCFYQFAFFFSIFASIVHGWDAACRW